MFFLVFEDVEELFREIESFIDIRYYKAGLLDNNSIIVYNSIFSLPNLGIAVSGDWNRIDTFLVLKAKTNLNIREVPQKIGGMKYVVDQMSNQKSVEFKLGGIYPSIDNVIVAGRVATISEDNDSTELYKIFSTKIKKAFKKIGTFYVGKVAEEKLKSGWRLVTNEKSPREYDLVAI